MEMNFLPIVRASSVIRRNKTLFQTLDQKVIVEAPQLLIQDIVSLCDGTRQCQEIVDQLSVSWDRDSIASLLQGLLERGVLADARLLGEEFWKAVENPLRFSMNLTKEKVGQLVVQARDRHRLDENVCNYEPDESLFAQLLRKRRSIRNFSGETVDLQSLVNILWSAYGEFESEEKDSSHRTTPSAGALYPLVVHVVLFDKTGDLDTGVYEVCYNRHGRLGFKSLSSDADRVARSFLDPRVLNGTKGVIVLSGSTFLSGEKYANRGVLYTLLEAGHVAQNIHVQAVSENVATLEIGGFTDQLLLEALHLQDSYRPFTTVAFGKEAFVSEMLPSLETSWAVPMAGQYRPSFAIASVRVSEKRSWSNGRDSSPKVALIKATSEAKEWAACGSIPDLIKASYVELESVVDPRSILKFHPAQYLTRGFPFKPFDKKRRYAWTTMRDYMTNDQKCVLADHVYFPYFPETPYYCFSNSSGCAAHPSEQVAVETATLELIERDSFMIAYLSGVTLPTIREKTLPTSIKKRIADLRSVGFEVWIKDHTFDLAPVVMVFVQNESLGYTKCASCSSFDTEDAISHALMEVEASVLSRLQNGRPATIKPYEVGNPLDHGRLYADRRYYRKADFLVLGGMLTDFQKVGMRAARSWSVLLDRLSEGGLQLLTISLGNEAGGNDGLHIVRSIVPGLVPMTFGYQQEPLGMERIYTVSEKFGGRKLSYGQLPKIPHPFE